MDIKNGQEAPKDGLPFGCGRQQMRWWHPVIAPVGQAGSIRGASTHFPQPPMPLLGLPVGASAGQALSAPGQLVSESRMCRRQIRRQARTLGHCSAEAAVLALRPVSLDTLSRREEFERPTWSRHTITANFDQEQLSHCQLGQRKESLKSWPSPGRRMVSRLAKSSLGGVEPFDDFLAVSIHPRQSDLIHIELQLSAPRDELDRGGRPGCSKDVLSLPAFADTGGGQ